MQLLSVHPACSPSLETSLELSSCLSEVLDYIQPLAYNQDCSVSLQQCKTTGAKVVVKTYVKARLSALAKEQVLNEVFIHAGLVHEHIVPLLATVEDQQHLHLLVQWADRGDLRKHMACLSETSVRDFLVRPLLHALAALDVQGIVHRDLKPENVLVHEDGVQLADFGLSVYSYEEPTMAGGMSRESSACSSLTDLCLAHASSSASALDEVTSMRLTSCDLDTEQQHSPPRVYLSRPACSTELMSGAGGTPMYSAPEVLCAMFESKPAHEAVTHKNDVWALGMMALESLLRQHPYSPSSICFPGGMFSCNLLYAVAHHPGFALPATLPPLAADFLTLALQVDPSKRPSARELLMHPWLQN